MQSCCADLSSLLVTITSVEQTLISSHTRRQLLTLKHTTKVLLYWLSISQSHSHAIATAILLIMITYYNYYYNRFTAHWTLSGTTRVSQYQKKHSPTHTNHGHQPSLTTYYNAAKYIYLLHIGLLITQILN